MLRNGKVLTGITKLAAFVVLDFGLRQLAKLIKRELDARTALINELRDQIENRNNPIPAINDIIQHLKDSWSHQRQPSCLGHQHFG